MARIINIEAKGFDHIADKTEVWKDRNGNDYGVMTKYAYVIKDDYSSTLAEIVINRMTSPLCESDAYLQIRGQRAYTLAWSQFPKVVARLHEREMKGRTDRAIIDALIELYNSTED